MIRYGGFSAIGQTHLNIGLPNQDSFGIYRSKKRKKELVLVISDGIGSHKHSDIGSMAIVKAVTKNAHLLYDRSNKNNFIKKTMKSFFKIISPYKPEECGTTCIFSAIFKDRICFGQIGDGICCYKINEEFHILNEKSSDFLNETMSVTVKNSINRWDIKFYNHPNPLQIMMATDGIADDLVPDMRETFLQRLNDATQCKSRKKIEVLIKQLFDNWERPMSYDDKTLLLCFEEENI